MTSFQATLVNAGYGQLALRDQNGKIAQKWTLGQPKCVIGAHANCNVRCMLPGVADHHLLLVIGARQIYMRALSAGVQRDGMAVNELVMSGDHSEFTFDLAGHRFEYSRQNSTIPIAKSFVEEGASPARPEPTKSEPASSKRLRFTFVQALEKNRDRHEASGLAGSGQTTSAVQATSSGGERPAWVEEIVRDALKPVELRLETIAQPINNLERQLRRQRARLRKQHQARKLNRHAAHEVGAAHTQDLLQAQETVHKIVADQSARLELVNERVSDIVAQLASLERIVSAETDQHQQVASRTSQSGEEIIRLQREMLTLVGALETRIAQPPVSSGEDTQWRASIERQLEELQQSLGILDEIKSSLDVAVTQNRELTHDLEAHWQAIEDVAKRPVVIQSMPAPQPTNPQPSTPPSPAAPLISEPIDSAVNLAAVSSEARALLEATALESPATPSDFRATTIATSPDPLPLPSWWSEDPVAPSDANRSIDPSPAGNAHAASDGSYYGLDAGQASAGESARILSDPSLGQNHSNYSEGYPSSTPWQPTEYELEINAPAAQRPWSGGSQSFDDDALQSPLAESAPATASVHDDSHSYAEQTYRGATYPEPAAAAPSDPEQIDIRNATESVSQSAAVLDDQLQKWLSDGYDQSTRPRSPEADHSVNSALERLEIDAEPAVEHDFLSSRVIEERSAIGRTANDPVPAADDEYAVSAFSAERLSLDGVSPEPSPQFNEVVQPEGAPYDLSYRSAEYASESRAPASASPTARASEAPATTEGADESVEDYMRRLLARMRGVSETEIQLPGLDRDDSPKPEARSRARLDESTGMPRMSGGSSDTEPASEAWTEPFESTKYVPRVAAPENNHDIDALRELANTSARSAIQVSARRKHGAAILIKSAVALVGLAAGAALVSINGLRVNIGLVATLASFMVALIWGYDALATLRPLLQASRPARPHSAEATSADSEVSEQAAE